MPQPSSGDRVRPVTLSDVARAAGVSQSTASRAFNGSARRVDEALKQRVLEAAARLNYVPNTQAQAVARGRTTTIALLVSDIADAYFSSMAAAMMAEAESAGLRVSVIVTERRIERELEVVREVRGQHARAIVLAGSGYRDAALTGTLRAELDMVIESGGRVVTVSRGDLPFESVDFDNAGGARQLGASLARLGYRDFLVLAGEPELVATQDRVAGFRAGLADAGIELDDDRVIPSAFSWEGARDAVQRLGDDVLAGTRLVFAVNDEMALGAVAALRGRGFRIPEDISVAGFDDIRTLRDVVPGLTTVHVPIADLAAEVVGRIAHGVPGAPGSILPTSVVLRDSTPRLN
ncbi:LacI family DNA-binding transcriptional regulator [Salinibacterium soli]|uniref:LacI family DNA-binding transcriptional regulator n=1 Tax=Antiquaquibacter soli TaxID=3064523 RepID=A0ABT9BP64_9MICO|nr:LacI family DNA-binding transcriptional regulator [Protaetiibacter sp. WY-16]MDO7882827.1 LacI family DNA-binding transcriptional regulator [Protaetiibacter sp. WY-16]